jgi:hypothetical protein
MRSAFIPVFLVCLATVPMIAVAQPIPFPPSYPAPPAQSPPTDCTDARNSPDYVPGLDARGRPVAPADIPGSADVEISTEVYAELRSPNAQLRGVGVSANLAGLATRPPCAPKIPKATHPKH